MSRAANLIQEFDATVALLLDPLEWRVRAVEEVVIDAATSCERRRSLQIAALRPLLEGFVDDASDEALIALPIAPMPRGPMVDFTVEGPRGDGWLLPRTEIATLQARYLNELAGQAGVSTTPCLELLETILGFTGQWIPPDGLGSGGIRDYLDEGLGEPPPSDVVVRCEAIADSCSRILRPRTDRARAYSAPENPALVLPDFIAQRRANSLDEAMRSLDAYREVLDAVSAATRDEPSAADEFLNSLADYANHYDLIVAMRVPLDEPFIVRISERRQVKLGALRNSGAQELVIADANTNHVTLKVLDPNVRIKSVSVRVVGSGDLPHGALNTRQDSQSYAFYAHEPNRDYRALFEFRLAPLFRLQFVSGTVATLQGLLITALLIGRPHDLKSLALIAGPAALAASVLVTREPSTLGPWLRRKTNAVVSLLLIVLLTVSAILYATGKR